jgi:hypothetical protein
MPNKAFAADFGKAGEKIGRFSLKFGCARLPEAAETRSLAQHRKAFYFVMLALG